MTLNPLTELRHDGLADQTHPGACSRVEVVCGAAGGRAGLGEPEAITPEPVAGVSEHPPHTHQVIHQPLLGRGRRHACNRDQIMRDLPIFLWILYRALKKKILALSSVDAPK